MKSVFIGFVLSCMSMFASANGDYIAFITGSKYVGVYPTVSKEQMEYLGKLYHKEGKPYAMLARTQLGDYNSLVYVASFNGKSESLKYNTGNCLIMAAARNAEGYAAKYHCIFEVEADKSNHLDKVLEQVERDYNLY